MTAEPVRDIGFAAWTDPDAWMENMEGQRWRKLIKQENDRVEAFTKKTEVKNKINTFLDLTKDIINTNDFVFQSGLISILMYNAFFLDWRWNEKPKKIYSARDVISDRSGVWFTSDVGNGSESFQLDFMTGPNTKATWSLKPVGDKLAIDNNLCYYLGVVNRLWYNEVWSCNKLTGENKFLIYRETDPTINLTIERAENHKIFVIREKSQDKWYYELKNNILREIPDPYKYKIIGNFGIETIWNRQDLVITKYKGQSRLINMKTNKILLSIPAGQIIIDPWAIHENRLSSKILVSTPNNPIHIFMLYNKSLIKLNNPVSNLLIERNETTSTDGTIVNYATVYKKHTIPKHLLVIGYGAYGMPTSASYARTQWNPLLENDWGIVYTFIRGGGDHTEAWAKAGRRDGRTKTIEDYLACIKSVKTQYNLQAKDVVLYGRSAGGLLLGGALAMEPSGNLFGGLFCEVPYVDELRTTTNPELPLTQLEYNEFGNPIHRLIDFLSVGKLSPADSAVGLKTPNIFVYCKTAVHDSEVFTYEPVKWVNRLRAGATKGKPKLLKIDLDSGHFTSPEKVMKTYAFDCAIIDSLVK